MQKRGDVKVLIKILIFSIVAIALPVILLNTAFAEEEKAADKCRNVKYQSLCYSLAAQSERDESICEKIQDKALRENCIKTAEPINRNHIVIAIAGVVFALFLLISVTMIRKRLVSLKSKRTDSAKSFVADAKLKGYSNEAIRDHLMKNKVPADVIDRVLPKK